VRAFQSRTFTPAELRSANAATVIPFPDAAARRRLTRRERIAWGGGDGGGGAPVPSSTPPSVAAASPADRAAPLDPGRSVEAMRAELAAEVGDAIAAALPIDVLEIACRAWGRFRGRGS
jgi:hypothetical protein